MVRQVQLPPWDSLTVSIDRFKYSSKTITDYSETHPYFECTYIIILHLIPLCARVRSDNSSRARHSGLHNPPSGASFSNKSCKGSDTGGCACCSPSTICVEPMGGPAGASFLLSKTLAGVASSSTIVKVWLPNGNPSHFDPIPAVARWPT